MVALYDEYEVRKTRKFPQLPLGAVVNPIAAVPVAAGGVETMRLDKMSRAY
jgi:hypothetical protein